MSRSRMYELRNDDEDFAAAWDEAEQIATDALEAEARRRAVDGWEEPVFYQVAQVATVRKYSDRMLELLLRGHRPERYKDRLEHTGPGGGPLQIGLSAALTDALTKARGHEQRIGSDED